VQKYTKSKRVDWQFAPDIKKRTLSLIKELDINWIKASGLYFFRSTSSTARAYARIWGLNRVWQMALKAPSSYIIEVLSERFDKLSEKEKDKVILHELTHIPRNFSGALVPHTKKGKGSFHDKLKTILSKYHKK